MRSNTQYDSPPLECSQNTPPTSDAVKLATAMFFLLPPGPHPTARPPAFSTRPSVQLSRPRCSRCYDCTIRAFCEKKFEEEKEKLTNCVNLHSPNFVRRFVSIALKTTGVSKTETVRTDTDETLSRKYPVLQISANRERRLRDFPTQRTHQPTNQPAPWCGLV